MAKIFTTLRWLRRYQSKLGNQVFIRIRMNNGFETEVPVYDYVNYVKIPISVKRENWKKGYVTGGKYHISVRDLNHVLSQVENRVKDAVQELIENNIKINRENILRLTYIIQENALVNDKRIASGEVIVNEEGGAFESYDDFKEFISQSDDPQYDSLKKDMGIYEKSSILDYWDEFIRDYAPNSYNAPKHAIEEYIRITGDNCKVSEFSSSWLERFFKNIINNGYSLQKDGKQRLPYTITTIVKYDKHLKHFGDFLFEELKLLNNQEYKRFSLRRKSKKQSLIKYEPEPFINTQALYKKEFDWFYYFQFDDKELELARDMFILQVWSGGMRQVDFYKLSEQNFHKDSNGIKVWFTQHKTDDEVLNTVNQNYLDPILKKYPNIFKEFPKVHIYNRLLKNAAEAAGLKRKLKFRFEYIKDDHATEIWMEIYKKITNEWARNCAVSILAELGYPDDRISKFIGHRDMEMIKHYKTVHQKEISTMMHEVKPNFVSEL